MAQMKALISGCGIAGLSLAYWLARMGADVTIIELTPDLRSTGQQIDLRGPAIPLMDKMGVKGAMKAAVAKEPGTQIVNRRGRTVAYFPTGPDVNSKQGLSSEYEIMRGNLVKVLYDHIDKEENVRFLFNKTIARYTQDDKASSTGKVRVRFSDGQEDDFDLVVGADGVYSQTRKLMMGPTFSDSLVSERSHFAFFSIPSKPHDSNRWTVCFLPERAVLMSRQDDPDFLRAYMMVYGDQPSLEAAYETRDKTALRKAWASLLRGRGWESDRFCDGLLHSPESEDLYGGLVNFVKLPERGWSDGRVTLVGDAACASTLNGMGTTLAMVAGYVLAGEIAALLAKGETVHKAVIQGAANYETKLRPLAAIAQESHKDGMGAVLPQTTWGILLWHLAAWVASVLRLDKLGLLTFDNLHKWELPHYPDLDGTSSGPLKALAQPSDGAHKGE
ncbi:salicylate hydroxylase [Microdochium nivale]|nr:salicylate hydroxylase [Microdochium nivale]